MIDFDLKKYLENNRLLREEMSCPLPTRDLELNTRNRNSAIKADYIKYGPLNLKDDQYWKDLADHWNTSEEVARESKCKNCAAFDISKRMLECMLGEIQEDGYLGYCWMHSFKCHSERTCYTWAAGGPIDSDKVHMTGKKETLLRNNTI